MSEETPTTDALPLPAPNAGVPGQPAGGGGNAPEPLSMRAVLAIAPMRRMWYAQIVSVFGDFLALYAVITYMTFKLQATAPQVTGIQIAYMGPIAILGILAGVFVDRWPVKATLVTSDLLRAALCLLLVAMHSAAGFYVALASISVVSSFFGPAQGKALRSVIPMHGMRSGQALMQQVMFIMRIVGGPIAVIIVSTFGAKTCYYIDAISFLASAALITSIALKAEPAPQRSAVVETEQGKSAVLISPEASNPEKTGVARVLEDMKEGAGFIFHHAALLFVILAMAAGMFVMGCFGPLIAIYVRDILHAAGRTFSITAGMIGLGLLIGINVLNAAAKKVKHATLVYFGLIGIAVGTTLLAALPYLAVAILGLFIIGFCAGAIIVPAQVMIQQETPQNMLGRVGSTVMSLIFSAQLIGLVLSGVLAQHLSVRAIFGVCTGLLVVLSIAGKLWMEPDHTTPATA